MYKLISIALIVSVLGIACSVLRKGGVSGENSNENIVDSIVLQKVYRNNISREGYFIKKADIEVNTPQQKENAIATVKYNGKGEYLVSLKSRTGIEAARVFIGRDSIKINDRINKVLQVGSLDYIERKFNFTRLLFPLIFGDFINMELSGISDSVCVGGRLIYSCYGTNFGVWYEIDCSVNKTVKVIESGSDKSIITLLYSDFKKTGIFTFPGKIVVSGLSDEMVIKIDLQSIEVPWSGEMNFIPGSRYKILNLR